MDRNISRIYDQIVAIVRDEVKKASSRDRWGTAVSASEDGKVEVLVDGGEEPAPFQTTTKVHDGDRVLLSIDAESRMGTVKGNYSKPAVVNDEEYVNIRNTSEEAASLLDDISEIEKDADKTLSSILSDANTASGIVGGMKDAADSAGKTLAQIVSDADSAKGILSGMEDAATAAGTTLNGIYQDAESAKTSAKQANDAAGDALKQLSTVQDVVGVVEWAAQHDEQDMASFINSHLALTPYGLNVLLDNTSYRVHIGTLTEDGDDGVYIIDDSGHVVTTLSESITFDSERRQYIGNEDAYILFTPASGDKQASITIGGANVQLGSSKTLSQWEADMQQAVDDAAAAVQTAQDVPIVTISSTNGTVFKRSTGVATTLVATIFTPGGRIDNATELRRRFGNGAYLQWSWRDIVTDAEHVLLSSDSRIGNGGFTLTVSPEDIDAQAVIACSLNY